jgi:hypothetical protein
VLVIDTNTNVSGHLADLKAKGVTHIGRYYSSAAWKRLTRQEAVAACNAGFQLFVVFENNGDPELSHEAGVNHGQIALAQAKAVAQPEGSAIYFALEHLPNGYKKADLPGIRQYIQGVKSVLDNHYRVGAYSNGSTLDALLTEGLCKLPWLSASLGFEGSKAFLASGKWVLAQDPHVDQDWNGVSVDVDQAQGDFGAFSVASAPNVVKSTVETEATASTFGAKASGLAYAEWEFFGKQTKDKAGKTLHSGHTEGEPGFYQRVGDYWLEGTNTHGIDGRNHDWFWSATFISWLMRKAGAGARFRYSTQHSVYISQGIRDYLQKRQEAGYWTMRLADAAPTVGDIVCWSRGTDVDYDHQNGGDYPGHSDLVVQIDANQAWIIGGNVGNSVTLRPLDLDGNGFLRPTTVSNEVLFAIMKNRMT